MLTLTFKNQQMDTPNAIELVATFHKTFNHPIINSPMIPDSARCDLRINLLAEELEELKEAVQKNSIIDVADALCDLQYVLAGAVLEFGLGEKFKELFYEVQRSNMSKAARSKDEAIATIQRLKKDDNIDAYYEAVGDLYLVYRKSDNKILKSCNYSPANLAKIIHGR